MTLTTYRDCQELFGNCVFYVSGNDLINPIINTGGTIGTLNSAFNSSNDRFGNPKSILSDNTSRYISYGNIHNFAYNLPFSIGLWIKQTAQNSGYSSPISKGGLSGDGYKGWGVELSNSSTPMCLSRFWLVNAWTAAIECNIVYLHESENILNEWMFLVWTKDATANAANMKCYKDGVNITGAAQNNTLGTNSIATNNPLQIGYSSFLDTPAAINSAIGDVFIFNKELSASEIKQFYQLTLKKYLYPIYPGVRSCL